ncbi:MAG: hypothetical protein JW395_2546 [Nitrospira sp.]|nr:hypothetical protein [Nitrospira sp.]
MTAVVGPLQFHDHKLGLFIHSQQVDPTLTILPVTEFLRQHMQFVTKDINLSPEQSLDI